MHHRQTSAASGLFPTHVLTGGNGSMSNRLLTTAMRQKL